MACYGAVLLKGKLGYDDSLDAFGVHGVGGALGSLLLGLFARKVWNSGGADGLFAGNAAFFGKQLLAVGVSIGYAVGGTFVLLKVVNALVGLRVSAEEEHDGLDIHLHGEEAYNVGVSSQGRSEIFGQAESVPSFAKRPEPAA